MAYSRQAGRDKYEERTRVGRGAASRRWRFITARPNSAASRAAAAARTSKRVINNGAAVLIITSALRGINQAIGSCLLARRDLNERSRRIVRHSSAAAAARRVLHVAQLPAARCTGVAQPAHNTAAFLVFRTANLFYMYSI